MRPASGRFPFGVLVPVAVGGTVFAFACGSSSVHSVKEFGHSFRWVALVVLLVLAAGWASQRREAILLPRSVLLATGAFLSVALVSALWSVAPRLSVERAVSLAILFATALLLARACAGRPRETARVLLGVLGGATAVALAGLVVLAVAHGSAVQPVTAEMAGRFQGLGENPDTASLLYAVTLPIAVWFTLRSPDRRNRALGSAIALLLFGSIVASGSRGALIAAGIGALAPAVAAGTGRRHAALALLAVGGVLAVGSVLAALPGPSSTAAPVVTAGKPGPKPNPGFVDVESVYPLDSDVGRPLPGGGEPYPPRSFFGSSGRGVAWTGTIEQAWGRPLLGYGFGSEARVFVDRYYTFVGGSSENSYIGVALQLGTIGLALLIWLVAALALTGRRALRGQQRRLAAACLGVVCAGLAIAFVQSYLYSVGNIAAAAFWIPAFLLPAISVSRA